LTFVRSEEFVSRFEKLQLINPATVQQLLKAAVAEAVGAVSRKLDDGLEKTVLEGAEQAFIRKYADLRSSAKATEARILKLQACLNAAEAAVKELPKSPSTSQNLAPYKDILLELEQRFTRSLRSNATTAAIEESLRGAMRRLIVGLFRKELGAIKKRLELDSQKKVALLEREVRRLTAALEAASEDRPRRPERCLYPRRVPAGAISPDRANGSDPASKLRLSLLKELVQVNRDIRKAIAATQLPANGGRELDTKGMSPAPQCLKSPAGLAAPEPHHGQARVVQRRGEAREAREAIRQIAVQVRQPPVARTR
jgi:hypothetical protein